MFERYTERARRALFFARYEASQLGSPSIDTEHLLLGLIHEGKGIETKLFSRSKVPLSDIRRALEVHSKGREKFSTSVEIPFTAESKRVLQLAAEEADRLLHNYIGTEHLLLGILREESSAAAAILMQHGMRLNGVREDLVQLLSQRQAAAPLERPELEENADPVSGPSSFLEVRITPAAGTGGSTIGRPGSWTSVCDLRDLLSRICDCPLTRIELPSRLDKGERYEISIKYSPDQSEAARNRLLLAWIEAHFRVTIAREARPMDVYVLTAPQGLNPAATPLGEGGGGISFGSMGVSVDQSFRGPLTPESAAALMKSGFLVAISSISAAGASLAEFGQLLEHGLDRFIVDETGLEGRYDLQMTGDSRSTDEFRERLREQLGLVLTPGHRDVTMLVVRSAD